MEKQEYKCLSFELKQQFLLSHLLLKSHLNFVLQPLDHGNHRKYLQVNKIIVATQPNQIHIKNFS